MKKSFISLLFLISLFSQTIIPVYTAGRQLSVVNDYEHDIIHKLINIYNLKYHTDLRPLFIEKSTVRAFLKSMDSLNFIQKEFIAIAHIGITNERKRKYNVSPPYLQYRFALLKRKSKNISKLDSRISISYLKNSISHDFAQKYKDSLNITLKPVFKMMDFIPKIDNNNADLILFSDILPKINSKFEIYEYIPSAKKVNVVILFSKPSKIFNNFEPIWNYFFHSPVFYSLIRKHFNIDSREFFKNHK